MIFETSAGEIVLDHEVKVNTDEKLAAENRRKKVQRERAREVREIEDAERQILHDQLLQEYKPN